MKSFELFFNMLHFSLYKATYRLHLLGTKVNPFLLLGKIPIIKRKFEEQGFTLSHVVNSYMGGYYLTISGGALAFIVFLIVGIISLIINDLFLRPVEFLFLPLSGCMALSYFMCYVFVFQKEKFLYYFNELDKWPRKSRMKLYSISGIFLLVVIAAFVYSLKLI